MASTPLNQQPFRFLDLPQELRCEVYNNIEFPTTWHTLDRTQALFRGRDWPVPPTAQVYESRVTLIRPHTPLEILMTCHLINEEARPILKRKMEYHKSQPIRYLVDYSAARALVSVSSVLRSCLGLEDEGLSRYGNETVRDFVSTCTSYLSQTRRTQNGVEGVPSIEMTITHKSGIAYGREAVETMMWLGVLKRSVPARLVVICKSPFPEIQKLRNGELIDLKILEGLSLQDFPKETGDSDQAALKRGVFVRPLEEEAFEKHVEGLEFYR